MRRAEFVHKNFLVQISQLASVLDGFAGNIRPDSLETMVEKGGINIPRKTERSINQDTKTLRSIDKDLRKTKLAAKDKLEKYDNEKEALAETLQPSHSRRQSTGILGGLFSGGKPTEDSVRKARGRGAAACKKYESQVSPFSFSLSSVQVFPIDFLLTRHPCLYYATSNCSSQWELQSCKHVFLSIASHSYI